MKQLLLTIMLSVVCSIVAVSWFSTSANANGTQQGNQGSRSVEQNAERRHAGSGEHRDGGHDQSVRQERGQNNRNGNSAANSHASAHNHGRSDEPSIAGFRLENIENSITNMTKKLALDTDQQQILRKLLNEHNESAKILRQRFSQSRTSVLALNPLDEVYSAHKDRLVKTAVESFNQSLVNAARTREEIFFALNETQQKILLNLEPK